MDSISADNSYMEENYPQGDMTDLNYDDYLAFLSNITFDNYTYFTLGDFGFDQNELTKSLPFPFDPGESVDENAVYRNFIFLGLYVMTFIFGLSGNIFSLCVFLRIKRLGLNLSVLLMNLTVSDLTVLLLCVPLTLVDRFKGEWIHGKIACKVVPFLQGCTVYSSSLSVSFLSLLYAMSKNRAPSLRHLTSRKEYLIITIIWLVALLMSTPFAIFTDHNSKNIMGMIQIDFCEEKWPTENLRNLYNIGQFVLISGTPTIALLFSLGFRLRSRSQEPILAAPSPSSSSNTETPLPSSVGHQHNNQHHHRTAHSAVLCLILLCLLFLLPYQIIIIYMDMRYQKEDLAKLALYGFPFAMWLVHSITVIHPFIYGASTRAYRNIFCIRSASAGQESLGLFTRDWYVQHTTNSHRHANGSLVIDKVTVL